MADTKKIVGYGIGAAVAIATPLIMKWEGLRRDPYLDIVAVKTVCWGHTGADIQNRRYSEAECKAMLMADIEKHMAPVLKCSPILANHPYQLAAATSFTVNLGGPTYCGSSIPAKFQAKAFVAACNSFGGFKYVKAKQMAPGCIKKRNGQIYCVSRGLERRRADEMEICRKGLV